MEPQTLKLLFWVLFAIFGFAVFLFFLKNLTKQKSNSSSFSSSSSLPPLISVSREMTVDGIRSATDGFNALNLIKVGHSGEFFAGFLLGSNEKIVVKRGVREELKKELEVCVSLQNDRCLVPLVGHCDAENEGFFVVYKYMEKGDLASALAQRNSSLPWIVRMKVAEETAQALLFLHYGCTHPILHSDVKSSSVLMGKNYQVRLGSLSRAKKVEEEEMLSYDVWCFGKLLMDLISGLDVSGGNDAYAQKWLHKTLAFKDLDGLLGSLDPNLVVEDDLAKEILGVAILAKACLSQANLLTMKLVCQVLEQPTRLCDGNDSTWFGPSAQATAQLSSLEDFSIDSKPFLNEN